MGVNKLTIHILEVCEAYGGGVKKQVDFICDKMAKDKYFPIFLVGDAFSEEPIPAQYLLNKNFKERKLKNIIKSSFTIKKIISDKNIELIHAHSTIAGISCVLYKKIYHSKVPLVYTPHAYYSESVASGLKKRFVIFVEKIINKNCNKIIHVSDDEYLYAKRKRLSDDSNGIVINNGIPEFSKKICTKPIPDLFVNVARCSAQKNPDDFIKLATAYCKKNENAKFLWIGSGPLLEKCREKVKKIQLSKKIIFYGYSSQPYDFLKKATAFISTSEYEGLPFSVIEALALKKPLLLTNVTGHRDLICNNGFYIDALNESESIKNIDLIQNNYDKLSDNSYELFHNKFLISTMIRKIEDVYDGCLNK